MSDHPVAAGQQPLAIVPAVKAVLRCILHTALLLARRQVHQSKAHVGQVVAFGDGSAARVYRETVIDRAPAAAPAVLVVGFRLKAVRGHVHQLFEWESVLNAPLFVGFPGLISKLWLAHDSHGLYRGIYQWDDPESAEDYARALWRVLALVSVPGSIGYRVIPGLRRDEFLDNPQPSSGSSMNDWWRPVGTAAEPGQ